jgi:hypothetical protein
VSKSAFQRLSCAAQALKAILRFSVSRVRKMSYKVEAAGIEPASRGPSAKASTCVVDVLVLTRPGSRRQDPTHAVRERFLTPDVPDVTRGDSDLVTSFWASPIKARSRGRL